ncbi:MAG: metallophosphoesterase family protein [Bacteroidales bacterium]|jgi:putative phosphoesterase|nr:metallophosphoesterase family protein [Bacteroidales bacterium]
MKRIGIISDTHSSLPSEFKSFFKDVDEIWHAGDLGSIKVVERLEAFKPLKAVYGNIDEQQIRSLFPEYQLFDCEGLKVLLIHIGGYPNKYDPKARSLILRHKPGLFVCGHSHILKVMYDDKHNLLHINPGAAGNFGLHRQITMIRFTVENARAGNLEVFDKPRWK